MASDKALATYEKYLKVRRIRWYNLSYKPAIEKQVANGKLSRYLANKLLEPGKHLERKRIPSPFILKSAVKEWND